MFDDGNDGRITSPRRLLRAAMPVTPLLSPYGLSSVWDREVRQRRHGSVPPVARRPGGCCHRRCSVR